MDLEQFDEWGRRQKIAAVDTRREIRAAVLSEYRELVEHLRKSASRSDGDARLYRRALEDLYADELTHLDLVQIARGQRWPVTHADSFWRSVVTRRRKKQLGRLPEKYLGLDKVSDEKFAELCGARTVRTLFTGSFSDLPQDLSGVVLKPVRSSGARGAFYIFDGGTIFSILRSHEIPDRAALVHEIKDQMLVSHPDELEWQVQELVMGWGRPARDVKFYSFYGQIGLIQEVSRFPRQEYEFFDEDFDVAPCGRDHEPRFADPADTLTDKGGLTEAKLETARRISRQIPAPFVRIDFLNADDELVFCEFSAAPGMSSSLSPEYDRLLGQYYSEAEIRLVNDLLDGARFEAFEEFQRWRAHL